MFLNQDPIAEQGGLNLYGFCANNGVNRWDYLGLDAFDFAPGTPDWVKLAAYLTRGASYGGGGYGSSFMNPYDLYGNDGYWVTTSPGGPASTSLGDRLAYDRQTTGAPSNTPGLLDAYFNGSTSGPGFNGTPGTDGTGSQSGDGIELGTALQLPKFVVAPNRTEPGTFDGAGTAMYQGALDYQKGWLGVGTGNANSQAGQLGRGAGYVTLIVPAVELFNGARAAVAARAAAQAAQAARVASATQRALVAEQAHLRGVLAAQRAQLQNARDIAAYELRQFGNQPNPYGLGRELNQLPQEISQIEARLAEIARLVGGGTK